MRNELATNRFEKIEFQKVKIVYGQLPTLLVVNVMAAVALVYGLWDYVPLTHLLTWLMIIVTMVFSCYVLWFRYLKFTRYKKSSNHTHNNTSTWRLYFSVGSAAAGIFWGTAGVLFVIPTYIPIQFFVLFILMGMGAGALMSLTITLSAFYLFLVPLLLPVSITLLFQNEAIYVALGICTLLYLSGLCYLAKFFHSALIDSIDLRIQNLDLSKKLYAQKEATKKANISKSTFLAAASHDLRQPLHALSLLHSILDDTIKDDCGKKVIQKINLSTNALESLFNSLLDISRLEAGVLQTNFSHFPLRKIFDKLESEFSTEINNRSQVLVFSPCDTVLNSDAVLLELILRNFVANAIRYTPSGKILLHCEVSQDSLHIHVSDTGIGIEINQQQEVFQEFHQLNNPEKDRNKGLGIGLTIVQKTAKLLEHPISLVSAPGQGSTFSITVPRGSSSQALVDEARALNNDTSGIDGVIVLVDKDVQVRKSIHQLFESWGFECYSAAFAEDIVDQIKVRNLRIQGIIADYCLPESKTGIDAIQLLHDEFGNDIPAVLIIGVKDPDVLQHVISSNLPLLYKPIAPSKLRDFLWHSQRLFSRVSS
ncbi:MAG: ATP-binding protein [Thiohalomonadales bacterium]